MLTTRRSENGYESYGGKEAVGVLERERPYNSNLIGDETEDEAKARMHKNLDKILNFDRYAQISEEIEVKDEAATIAAPVQETAPVAEVNEDATPTSTTMQFGDGNAEVILNDEREREYEKQGFKLNLKGKIVLALYAVAVTVILALIIVNSGVLMALKQSNANSAAELNSLSGEYNRVVENIRSISGDDYISGVAENDLGMIK